MLYCLSRESISGSTESVTVPAQSTRDLQGVLRDLKVGPRAHAHPRLYFLDTRLNDDRETVDDAIERIGFQDIHVRYNRPFSCRLPNRAHSRFPS